MHRMKWIMVALLASGAALAKTSDRDLPAEIESGGFVEQTDFREFNGGFSLRQGTLVVEAERARVWLDRSSGEISRILLTGAPVVWQEELDSGCALQARASTINYDLVAKVVLLQGGVLIDRGRDQLSGESIRYDLTTERLDAGSEEGRVKLRLNPRATQDPC